MCPDILGIARTDLGMIMIDINATPSQTIKTKAGLIINTGTQAQADRIPKIQNSNTRTNMDIQLHYYTILYMQYVGKNGKKRKKKCLKTKYRPPTTLSAPQEIYPYSGLIPEHPLPEHDLDISPGTLDTDFLQYRIAACNFHK